MKHLLLFILLVLVVVETVDAQAVGVRDTTVNGTVYRDTIKVGVDSIRVRFLSQILETNEYYLQVWSLGGAGVLTPLMQAYDGSNLSFTPISLKNLATMADTVAVLAGTFPRAYKINVTNARKFLFRGTSLTSNSMIIQLTRRSTK